MSNPEKNNGDKIEQPDFQENSPESKDEQVAPQQDVFGNPIPRAASESETMASDIKEGRLSGFVGNGTSMTGELNFRAMARIDGLLTGKVSSEKGTLIIGSSGQVDANVSVGTAIINGTVNGDVTTSEHLELKRTGKVVGNIRTPRFIMEDGAILEGNCSMLKAEEKSENRDAKQIALPSVVNAASVTAAKNNLAFNKDNLMKDKKTFETGGKNDESSKLILDVV